MCIFLRFNQTAAMVKMFASIIRVAERNILHGLLAFHDCKKHLFSEYSQTLASTVDAVHKSLSPAHSDLGRTELRYCETSKAFTATNVNKNNNHTSGSFK